MRRILDWIFSMAITGVALLLFAVVIGMATFIENDFGSSSAWSLVYGSKGFELLLLYLACALMYNIYRFNMISQKKIFILTFHASFLLILIGAAMTRYLGYEGTMHIRENGKADTFLSNETYISLQSQSISSDHKVLFSRLGDNSLHITTMLNNQPLTFDVTKVIFNAQKEIEENAPQGIPYIGFMSAGMNGAEPHSLKLGETLTIGNLTVAFDNSATPKADVIFSIVNNNFVIKSHNDYDKMNMDTQAVSSIQKESVQPLEKRHLYSIAGHNFVFKTLTLSGKEKLVEGNKNQNNLTAVLGRLSYQGKTHNVTLWGDKGIAFEPVPVQLGTTTLFVGYGSKTIKLPFSLFLNKFSVERYPGSMTPNSYKSSVTVEEGTTKMPYEIYMNHVLDHGGYRFFQSSYDMDEKGTILSVSHDPGKIPTYIGYALLFASLLASFFVSQGRFQKLLKKLNSIAVVALVVFLSYQPHAYAENATQAHEMVNQLTQIDAGVSEEFSKLLVLDNSGRLKPIDSLAYDILNKVSRSHEVLGLSANQVLLGMLTQPKLWQNVKMIKVSHPKINEILGLNESEKRIAFNDLFNFNSPSPYKLTSVVEEANRKKPAERSTFDNEVIKLDERVNVSYMLYTGELLKIFPMNQGNKWLSPTEALMNSEPQTAEEIRNLLMNLFKGLESHNIAQTKDAITKLHQFQTKQAPSMREKLHVEEELFLNKTRIFENLTMIYGSIGLLLLIVSFVNILKPSLSIRPVIRGGGLILALAFMAHTFGLGLRWYVSGHAPWSNGYESLTYIAWATLLSGVLFIRRSPLAFSATAILASVILFVAHLSWMDPQITNLVPVLQSYWLVIHVAVITASYGFLGLGALLAFLTLILYSLRNPNKPHIDTSIIQLSRINEMGLMIGLVLLTIGNFLGGIWANESWGRYWGWDPKETWALVTILTYTFVLHARFIPQLKTLYAFNVMALLAFSTVLMTYFGVNFYLSGLHSYAAGDPLPIPSFVWYAIGVIAIIIGLSARKKELKEMW